MSQLLNTDKYGVSALETKEMKTIDGGHPLLLLFGFLGLIFTPVAVAGSNR